MGFPKFPHFLLRVRLESNYGKIDTIFSILSLRPNLLNLCQIWLVKDLETLQARNPVTRLVDEFGLSQFSAVFDEKKYLDPSLNDAFECLNIHRMKQIIQIDINRFKIPTDRKLTRWLFCECSWEAKLEATEKIKTLNSRVETLEDLDLNGHQTSGPGSHRLLSCCKSCSVIRCRAIVIFLGAFFHFSTFMTRRCTSVLLTVENNQCLKLT